MGDSLPSSTERYVDALQLSLKLHVHPQITYCSFHGRVGHHYLGPHLSSKYAKQVLVH